MFRKMRRFKQQLTDNETIDILKKGTSGVLAVCGDEGYPYAVPISYVYADGKIYLHSAVKGHKIDALKNNKKVSFCVIGKDEVIPENLTTYYRSAIVFGKARILEDKEAENAINLLMLRYSPNMSLEKRQNHIKEASGHIAVIEIEIEHITGKASLNNPK